ncbi:MAG: NAD(P)/FAD-dependent oxidoreductase [Muribaculaceae bacterium]|nr:NAD(P)/FAD-dependent oxidoreductase [Muribaculaceae bacterium]
MTQDLTLRLSPREAATPEMLRGAVCRALRIKDTELNDLRVIRKSVDARQKNVVVNLGVRVATGEDRHVVAGYVPEEFPDVSDSRRSVIIVGAGPAGLFAALRAIKRGVRPVVLERGKDVEERRMDITRLNRERSVDPESNYCFGEGGAGAFSDGKLFTRSKKRGNVMEVLGLLHQFGADESVMIDSHPHIGSDRLPGVIKAIREEIRRCGGEVIFQAKVSGLLLEEKAGGLRAAGVKLADGRTFSGDAVILATGHSARDVYRFLDKDGVRLESKGIAMGVRLEHPQDLIDRIQYHSPEGRGEWLPAAEYSFVTQADGRGVYSFCMCPGGVIVPAASAPGELVVNGMSASARAGKRANSGMVVEIRPGDISGYDEEGPFGLLRFQEDMERKFFEASGNTINAPAQRMKDFVEGRKSETLPGTSYIPGIHSERMDQLLHPFIAERLKEGFRAFGRKSNGFLTNEAVLIGLESRTSSPVRIPRDRESLCHPDIAGLYPCGEGAGFAGGIVSAAMDGMRCADAFADTCDYI